MTVLADHFSYPKCTLRKIKESDIAETVSHLNTAFKYQELATKHPRTNPEHLRKYMSVLDCYVIICDSQIVGTVALENKGSILHFGLVSVAEQYRGSGLATAIMKAVEDFAIKKKYTILELDFMSIAPWLKKYYENYGFTKTGHTESWKGTTLVQMHKKIGAKSS